MRTLWRYIILTSAYMRVNWRSALEYRTNFVFEALLSVLEIGMYLFYWRIFFSISDGIPGATFEQLAALVVFNHVIYGVADTLLGNNVWDASEMVIKGQIDTFLVQPKSAVYQIFFSGAQPLRAVQVVLGTVVYFLLLGISAHNILFLAVGVLAGSSIFISWVIVVHALTFRLGNMIVVYKLLSVMLHFAKKPASIFSAGVRMVLYTVIPAAYIGTVQAAQIFDPSPWAIAGLLTLAAAAPLFAVVAYRRGLRLYESGNLIGARM